MKFGYLDKFDRHETPVGEYHPSVQGRSRQPYSEHRPPVNMYQALMETSPLEDVPMTEEEREQDWVLFYQKIVAADLTERELLVLDCMFFGGMSLSRTALIICQVEGLQKPPSKMQVSRYRDRAVTKLRKVFIENERCDDE